MQISFVVPGIPVAKGRGRVGLTMTGRPMVFTPSKTRKAEESFAARAVRFRPPEPLGGALDVEFVFVMPVPKSWAQWKQAAALRGALWPDGKPDLSNLVKLAEDALNFLCWSDDAQIVRLSASKIYGPEPQTEVTIVALTSETTRKTPRNPSEAARGGQNDPEPGQGVLPLYEAPPGDLTRWNCRCTPLCDACEYGDCVTTCPCSCHSEARP